MTDEPEDFDLLTDQVKFLADEIIQTYMDEDGKRTKLLIMSTALVAYALGRMGDLEHEEAIEMIKGLGDDYQPFGDKLVQEMNEAEEEVKKLEELGENVIPFPNKGTIH